MESYVETYVLFRGNKRVTLRPEDMTTEKIGVIFQVQKETVYLTDDNNVAIFPRPDGDFNTFDLITRSHYEVHGDSTTAEQATAALPTGQPVRFSFHRSISTATSSSCSRSTTTKSFVRNILMAEVVNGKLETNKIVTVRFAEFEACVQTISTKVTEALGLQEAVILTDTLGNEIIDSEGTRGSAYWKQNSRKVFAVPEQQMELLQTNKRKRLSRKEDTGLQEVIADIEEVVEAAQGLKEVSKIIKTLTGQSTMTTTLCLSEAEVASLKLVFGCLVCTGPAAKPVFSTCCRSFIGCKECIERWNSSHDYCPKCRSVDLDRGIHEVAGLDEALAALEKLF
ncbi:uncharacterized protein LOC129411368 [Boleophthalmus pectinirostris]|uniref:uncharacterized protein LOC129410845 n=1 Tax=Boleophthalmus pectinirostris TaxID=150288 RepID=UPI00242BC95D|nr:uncharacterized protein LOC129410845 [Boleophthalmus pectinirostris]XP_055018053.1 uncharacterized protein LOC129411368 [Boleophthalmus pectinirostris]